MSRKSVWHRHISFKPTSWVEALDYVVFLLPIDFGFLHYRFVLGQKCSHNHSLHLHCCKCLTVTCRQCSRLRFLSALRHYKLLFLRSRSRFLICNGYPFSRTEYWLFFVCLNSTNDLKLSKTFSKCSRLNHYMFQNSDGASYSQLVFISRRASDTPV